MQLHKTTKITKWTGGVDHNSETHGSHFSWWEDTSNDLNLDSDDPCSDEGEPRGRLKSLRKIEHEIQLLNEPIPFEMVMKKRTQKDWKKAERKKS